MRLESKFCKLATLFMVLPGFALAEPVCSNDLITIPAGVMMLGVGDSSLADERPPHQVQLDEFQIAKYEITLTQAKGFITLLPQEHPMRNELIREMETNPCNPVHDLTWQESANLCQSLGGRLPTEAEWVSAATWSPHAPGQLLWPTGDELPSVLVQQANQDAPALSLEIMILAGFTEAEMEVLKPKPHKQLSDRLRPVQESLQGLSGVQGMTGNVWEWVADWYGSFAPQAISNPHGPAKGAFKVIKGGSYLNAEKPELLRPQLRNFVSPKTRSSAIGVRCAWGPTTAIAKQ